MNSLIVWTMCKLLRVYNLITYRHFIKENVYASLFNNSAEKICWLKKEILFPSKSAANYSFLYIYLRVLLSVKPSSILEFGLGQSTVLSNAYARQHESVKLDVIEGNSSWVNIFCDQNNLAENTNVILTAVDMCEISVGKRLLKTLWYKNVPEEKYSLVVLDGPEGAKRYARSGIVNHIPSILSEEFVIIVDDHNVFPTRQTASLIREKLDENGIEYCEFKVDGTKEQLCIVSPCYKFLASI